jgi:hypothetical protein
MLTLFLEIIRNVGIKLTYKINDIVYAYMTE